MTDDLSSIAGLDSFEPLAHSKGKGLLHRDYLNRALEVQMALEARDTTYLVKIRQGLKHLNKDGLITWLISIGDRMNHRASWIPKDTMQTLLDRAEKSWNTLHKFEMDVSDLAVSEHNRLKIDNHTKPNEDDESFRPVKRGKITTFKDDEEVQSRADPDLEILSPLSMNLSQSLSQ